ncbi:hypothetical protein [Ancylobacter oerskovii]|uniref:Uncharacterized protein n=1 Tax=Ancylobacter oerskovii TaxID=459519 RepID=A0ABW4YUY1_9HYPH
MLLEDVDSRDKLGHDVAAVCRFHVPYSGDARFEQTERGMNGLAMQPHAPRPSSPGLTRGSTTSSAALPEDGTGRDKPVHDVAAVRRFHVPHSGDARFEQTERGMNGLAMQPHASRPSSPGSTRGSTTSSAVLPEDVDGRDKPGHDVAAECRSHVLHSGDARFEQTERGMNGLAMLPHAPRPSSPGLTRGSTTSSAALPEDVAGRDRPGHDVAAECRFHMPHSGDARFEQTERGMSGLAMLPHAPRPSSPGLTRGSTTSSAVLPEDVAGRGKPGHGVARRGEVEMIIGGNAA